MLRVAFFAALAAMPFAAPVPAQDREEAAPGSGAVLRALDKVNGKTVDITAATGETVTMFGLDVFMVECRYPARNPTGDAWAFLVVRETGARDIRFQGWMIASSPALNALDHARYDVWLLRCNTA
ncbi:MAG: DUF2155 domain-containing protein [Pseudomonadota bacterium]